MAITLVLVLKEYTHDERDSNVERFLRIGMRTYAQFLDLAGVAEFVVIVPKAELDRTRTRLTAAYPQWPWRVVAEDALVLRTVPQGWAKQQTAKIAVAGIVKTPHYLIVDDDTYLTKPTKVADLFDAEGRALMTKCKIDFPFFYLWSARAIDVDFDEVQDAPFHMGITPQIFVTDVVKELIGVLEQRYGDHMKWQEHLAKHKFTEYCMYWSYLIKKGAGTRERYYACACDDATYGHCTTSELQDMPTQVARSFTDNEHHFFSFVQSSCSKFTVVDVEREVTKHLNRASS